MSQVILPRTGILAFMDDESRQKFATYGSVVSTAPGEVLIQEKEVNTRLYIVLSGSFDVSTEALGKEKSSIAMRFDSGSVPL